MSFAKVLGAGAAIVFLSACTNKAILKPSKPMPADTAVFQFTSKIEGPLELTLNGQRIAVEGTAKNKKARRLVVTGLTQGEHRFFLYSPKTAFGPDQGTFTLKEGQGHYQVLFARAFQSTLYGQAESLTQAESTSNIKAHLER